MPDVVSTTTTSDSDHKKTRGWYYMIPQGTFIYYNQGNLGCNNATYRSYGCLPACCLMGAHLFASPLAVTPAQFTAYCIGMSTASPNGTYIPNAYAYLKNNVFFSQIANQAQQKNAAGRSATIAGIKSYLLSNRSVVVRIQYKAGGYKIPTTAPATNIAPAVFGHFVLIVGLNETTVGNGTVYYYDPNNNPGLKSFSWSAFLDAMQTGSTFYNYMRIGN